MSDPFIGEIKLFGGDFVPRDWAFCHGQIMQINDNQALFAIIGTIYGGDGRTTFALPDLRGRAPVGVGQRIGGPNWWFNPGMTRGNETAILGVGNLPPHEHTVPALTVTGGGAGSSTADLKVYQGDADSSDPGTADSIASKAGSGLQAVDSLSTQNPTTTIAGAVTGIASGGGGQTIPSATGMTGGQLDFDICQPSISMHYIIALQGVFPSRN